MATEKSFKADVSSASPSSERTADVFHVFRFHEGLTLETPALKFCRGQFTLSTQLIILNYPEVKICQLSSSLLRLRLVPDLDVELQPGTLSRVSSVSRISILQSEVNATRGMASTELLSDAPSENNSSGSSSVVPGQYLTASVNWRACFEYCDQYPFHEDM